MGHVFQLRSLKYKGNSPRSRVLLDAQRPGYGCPGPPGAPVLPVVLPPRVADGHRQLSAGGGRGDADPARQQVHGAKFEAQVEFL